MEKNCLVTKLKSRTGNTDLPVMGFMKIKVSYISELNNDKWNQFVFVPIKGISTNVKILGEGYIYSSINDRTSNTNGVKSISIKSPKALYCSNGNYEILIEKYNTDYVGTEEIIRSDNIHINYNTFENSNLTGMVLRFYIYNGIAKYPINISGSIKRLPSTITRVGIMGDTEHPIQLEDFAHISKNLKELFITAKGSSFGSFDDVEFNKVMDSMDISLCSFSGDIKNVPIAKDANINYGFNKLHGDIQEPIERMAKNATTAKDVYVYIQANPNVFWRDTPSTKFPKMGWLYLTLNGTGGVTVYSNEERTNLLGSFDGTTWTYPS